MPGEFWVGLSLASSAIFGISVVGAIINGVSVVLGIKYGLLLAAGIAGLLLLLRGSSERNSDRNSIIVYNTKDAVERAKRNLGGEKKKNVSCM